MLIKTLYAISKTTGFLAKTLERGNKNTEKLIEKEYIYKSTQKVKEATGKIIEKIGYAVGKIEEEIKTS